MYEFLKIVHLLCACVVVGYLVYDVFVFSNLAKRRSEEEYKSLKRELLHSSAFVLGVAFLVLIASGIGLGSYYLSLKAPQSTLEKLLWLKVALVASLFVLTPFSIFYVRVLKKRDIFARYYHHLALVICLAAVLLAKFMFIF